MFGNKKDKLQKAISKLTALKNQYTTNDDWQKLREHSVAIIRKNCSGEAISQFERLTKFPPYLHEEFRFRRTQDAIDIAITDLREGGNQAGQKNPSKNQVKTTGRTIPDLVADHPKISLTIFALVIGLILFALFMRKDIKAFGFEITSHDNDTVFVTRTIFDTLIVEKIVEKPVYRERQPDVDIKTDDNVGGKQNIVGGDNNGIMGDGNTVNIIPDNARHLTSEEQQQLLQHVSYLLIKNGLDRKGCVSVMSVDGDGAHNLAKEIHALLQSNEYKVEETIGQFVNLRLDKVAINFRDGCVFVRVGRI